MAISSAYITIASLTFGIVCFALMIYGFVQAYTYQDELSSRGSPPVSVMASIIGLCLCLEVMITIKATSALLIRSTFKYRMFLYGSIGLFGFFSMVFYASPVNQVEAIGSVACFFWICQCVLGYLAIKQTGNSSALVETDKLDVEVSTACCACTETVGGRCCAKQCSCCGASCCLKGKANEGCGMCCRWTLWVFALLFCVQAMIILADNNAYLIAGQATGGVAPTLITVNTYKPLTVSVFCAGSQAVGDPVVWLEAGGGSGMGGMIPLLNELVDNHGLRVCTYDRPGYGFSQSGYPQAPYTNNAHDVMDALSQLGESGPYVCAGHSAGGSKCRILHLLYPSRVVGLVMMDAYCNSGDCNIEVAWDVARGYPDAYEQTYAFRLQMTDAMRFFTPFLFIRLAIGSAGGIQGANYGGNQAWNAQYMDFRPAYNVTEKNELEKYMWYTPAVVGNTPLFIGTAGVQSTCEDKGYEDNNAQCTQHLQKQNATNQELVKYLATSVVSKYADCGSDCDHGYVQTKPDVAATFVMETVRAVRNGGMFQTS